MDGNAAGRGVAEKRLEGSGGKSTYEAVLTAASSGSYQVTAVNTLSKETVSTFQVTVK